MKSRISPNVKQQKLKAKLQTIKSRDELIKIFTSVQQQNNTLREDVYALKYKVDLLLQKQKNEKSFVSKQDEAKNKELHIYQKQLKQQYKIMQQLKKRREQSNYQKGTEELHQRASQVANKSKIVELELSQAKKQLADLKKEGQKLEITLANHEEEEKRNEPKINEYSSENGELKKKILSLRKIGVEKQHQSVKIMNSMYSAKTKYKKNQDIQQQIQNLKLSTTNQKVSKANNQTIDLQSLKKQVEELKKEVQRKEKDYNKTQAYALKKKEQTLGMNKQLVANQKELQEKKARALRQLNKYRSIWTKHLEMKNNSKYLKEFITTAQQIQEFAEQQQPLRRDYAGVMGGKFTFDDRIALKGNKKSFMVGFIVYQLDHTSTKNHLVALKILYDDPQANLNVHIPIPGQVLNKCKVSKYMLMQSDFIKLFKVKYQSVDSRIIKIEIRTNRNNRYEFGDKRQFSDINAGENVYGFDISVQEYPVSLFGSYNNVRTQWYLQSLGVQINQLSANAPLAQSQK